MIICGIDPGVTGAIAFYDTIWPDRVRVVDMPTSANEVDPALVAAELRLGCAGLPAMTVVEIQNAMPKQGVSSSFKLGRRYGILLGVLAALGWRWEPVSPVRWKAALKVGRDKDAARARASQLMPAAACLWLHKQDHGRAEAALLALYGNLLLSVEKAT